MAGAEVRHEVTELTYVYAALAAVQRHSGLVEVSHVLYGMQDSRVQGFR